MRMCLQGIGLSLSSDKFPYSIFLINLLPIYLLASQPYPELGRFMGMGKDRRWKIRKWKCGMMKMGLLGLAGDPIEIHYPLPGLRRVGLGGRVGSVENGKRRKSAWVAKGPGSWPTGGGLSY